MNWRGDLGCDFFTTKHTKRENEIIHISIFNHEPHKPHEQLIKKMFVRFVRFVVKNYFIRISVLSPRMIMESGVMKGVAWVRSEVARFPRSVLLSVVASRK